MKILPALLRLPLLYLPPVSWFAWAMSAEKIILGSGLPYRKQTLRNRCYIMSASGTMPLTIPVHKPGMLAPFSSVIPDSGRAWQRTHWRAVESAYSRSPFFLYYKDALEPSFRMDSVDSLASHNRQLIFQVADLLQLTLKEHITDPAATEPGGITDLSTYYLRKSAPPKGSVLVFPEYRQVFSERVPFAPDLSIIDLLFNLGPESRVYLRKVLTLQ